MRLAGDSSDKPDGRKPGATLDGLTEATPRGDEHPLGFSGRGRPKPQGRDRKSCPTDPHRRGDSRVNSVTVDSLPAVVHQQRQPLVQYWLFDSQT